MGFTRLRFGFWEGVLVVVPLLGNGLKRGWGSQPASESRRVALAAFPERLVMVQMVAQHLTVLPRSWHPGAKLELGIPFGYFHSIPYSPLSCLQLGWK